MEVETLDWEPDRAAELLSRDQPTLFMVGSGVEGPLCSNPLHDWVREPAADEDVELRLQTLAQRHAALNGSALTIELGDGTVRVGDKVEVLPPLEADLLTALLERESKVVSRQSLMTAVWPAGDGDRNRLDAAIHRLRLRVEPLGIDIVTVRRRGYMLRAG
ncbi:MAG: winged helix-turn-helix domain-containing protein [Acidimicrobiales bacterium]